MDQPNSDASPTVEATAVETIPNIQVKVILVEDDNVIIGVVCDDMTIMAENQLVHRNNVGLLGYGPDTERVREMLQEVQQAFEEYSAELEDEPEDKPED